MSGFTAAERAAMQQRAEELRVEAARPKGGKKAAEELDCLNKIAGMAEPDRLKAERLHALITTLVPDLAPKLWYGQPAYARNGKAVCFFRSGIDDKERYSTLGFSTQAELDVGAGVWPTSFAIHELTDAAIEQISAVLRRLAV